MWVSPSTLLIGVAYQCPKNMYYEPQGVETWFRHCWTGVEYD